MYKPNLKISLSVKIRNPWNNTYEMGPASYWHSSPGGAGGGTQQILYTIFHNFVYLLLTNGTPFTYLAYNFVSVLTAGNPHCHKIGISHKYRTLSRRVRSWTSGRSLPYKYLLSTVQYRIWSPTANDPETPNDPQNGPQMILDRKWSLKSTSNDPVKTWGME